MKYNIKKILLTVIIFISILLRFVGIRPGYPPYHSDEGMSYSQGISIIKENTIDAKGGYSLAYAYPSLIPVINAYFFDFVFLPPYWMIFIFENIGAIVGGSLKLPQTISQYNLILQQHILGARDINVLFWGRYVAALFGLGNVILIYFLAKKIFSEKIGLISAGLVAVNYRQVLNSHLDLPDIYNSFFLILSMIGSYHLFLKPTSKNYIIAGILAGLSFSTKFHIYAFFPFVTAHMFVVLKQHSKIKVWLKNIIFNKNIWKSIFYIAMVTVVLNFYHLLNLEKTLTILKDVSLKYRTGRMQFDFFPYSYLYHVGMGKLTSIFVLLGFIFLMFKNFFKWVFVSFAVIVFLFVITFYTGGGYYTRNFVTITPLLLIYPAVLLAKISEIKYKKIGFLLFSVILSIMLVENLRDSLIVPAQYLKPWNYEILSDWVLNNIPSGSIVAAHGSVPLPVDGIKRISYDFSNGPFSINEFKSLGSEFVFVSLDMATVDFYGWMAQTTNKSLEYWNKPVKELEESFSGMAIREISDYAIYWVIKPWQAPESNFIVAKVPKFNILNEKVYKSYKFEKPPDLWTSEPINIVGWQGYRIYYQTSKTGRGFIYLNFYKNHADIGKIDKRVAVRLSSRDDNKTLIGQIPKNATEMIIGFQTYNSYKSLDYLKSLDLYEADVSADYSGYDVKGVKLDDGVIFPNSQGNM